MKRDPPRIPDLALWCSLADGEQLRERAESLLSMLKRLRNVEGFAEWRIPPGMDRGLAFDLASEAPHQLVLVSPSALAHHRIVDILLHMRLEQDVTIFLVRPCMWEPFVPEHSSIVPVRDGTPIAANLFGLDGAWARLHRSMLSKFPTLVPDPPAEPTSGEREVYRRHPARLFAE